MLYSFLITEHIWMATYTINTIMFNVTKYQTNIDFISKQYMYM